MELQLRVNVRYAPQNNDSFGDVLRHFESPVWVRCVLRQVLPQLKRASPTDPNTLIKMALEATEMSHPFAEQALSCAICLTGGALPSERTAISPVSTIIEPLIPIALPCGHRFHAGCVLVWLKRRSTCPLCRFQLPKAYTGTYAIAAVQSMLVLPQEHETFSSSAVQDIRVGDQELLAIVKINMVRITSDALGSSVTRRQPCAVTAGVTYVNGSPTVLLSGRTGKREREEAVSRVPEAVRAAFKRVRAAVESNLREW